jgi:hypothetical protein
LKYQLDWAYPTLSSWILGGDYRQIDVVLPAISDLRQRLQYCRLVATPAGCAARICKKSRGLPVEKSAKDLFFNDK